MFPCLIVLRSPKHCPPCHSSSLQSGHFRACTTHRDVCSTKWCNICIYIYILWEYVIVLLCIIVQTDFFPSHWIQPLRSSLASEASYKLCHSCRSLNYKWFPIPNNPCLQLWWKIMMRFLGCGCLRILLVHCGFMTCDLHIKTRQTGKKQNGPSWTKSH